MVVVVAAAGFERDRGMEKRAEWREGEKREEMKGVRKSEERCCNMLQSSITDSSLTH